MYVLTPMSLFVLPFFFLYGASFLLVAMNSFMPKKETFSSSHLHCFTFHPFYLSFPRNFLTNDLLFRCFSQQVRPKITTHITYTLFFGPLSFALFNDATISVFETAKGKRTTKPATEGTKRKGRDRLDKTSMEYIILPAGPASLEEGEKERRESRWMN
jgi:hypothetical protein